MGTISFLHNIFFFNIHSKRYQLHDDVTFVWGLHQTIVFLFHLENKICGPLQAPQNLIIMQLVTHFTLIKKKK